MPIFNFFVYENSIFLNLRLEWTHRFDFFFYPGHLRSTFFVNDIFLQLQFLKPFIYYNDAQFLTTRH